jgi:cytochrome c biogenesis protein
VPFTVKLTDFEVKFETGPVQRGAARLFRADVEVTDAPGDAPRSTTLEVNHPLNIAGTTVHLIGHGYAPLVTVRDGNGDVAFSGPVVFLPQDGNFTSAGVIKAPDGRPQRLAFQGLFLPTAVTTGTDAAPTSVFPDALNPTLLLDTWYGPPKTETGTPENVYSLDTTGLTQAKKQGSDTPLRFALQPGDTFKLPNGLGSVTMNGWQRWIKLQVGDAPGMPISLGAIAFAVAGLCLSLFIRPRRVWVRVRRVDGAPTVVEVAGLDRADARAGLSEDVSDLADVLAGSQQAGSQVGSKMAGDEGG